MAHKRAAAPTRYTVRLGARGRMVLPASARRQLGVEDGMRLILTIEAPGQLRITSARAAAAGARGLLRRAAGERSLADELIGERRQEARSD